MKVPSDAALAASTTVGKPFPRISAQQLPHGYVADVKAVPEMETSAALRRKVAYAKASADQRLLIRTCPLHPLRKNAR